MNTVIRSALGGVAMTAALGAVILGGTPAAAADGKVGAPIVLAQAAAPPADKTFPPASESTPAKPPMHKASKADHAAATSPADHVEGRIAALHDKLHITAEQLPQWNEFAQTMRDNAKTMTDLTQQRMATAETRNAVDDLKSYEMIADAHADGLKKLIPAFSALYDTMSPDQKKTADTVFGHFEGHRPMARKS